MDTGYTKKIHITVVIVFMSLVTKAQDIHFSQFFAMPILVNPANAGVENKMDIGLIHRSQWKSVAQPYVTYGFSIAGRVGADRKKGNLGFGLDCYYDKSGDASFVSLQSGLNVAYNVRLSNSSFLSTGIKVNYNQRSINNTNFQWGAQYDGKSYNSSLPSGEPLNDIQRINFVDAAAGLNYRFKKGEKNISSNTLRIFDVGISAFHINRSNVALYKDASSKIARRVMGYFQGVIGIDGTNLAILPKLYHQVQGKQRETVFGTLLSIKPKNESKVTGYVTSGVFNIGAFYRVKDAVIAVAQYEVKNYVIGVSYDINVSKLTTASNGRGAYEISLRYMNSGAYLRKSHHSKYGTNKFL